MMKQLNEAIKHFPAVSPITKDMRITHEGVSRLIMLDRYSFKDTEKKTLRDGDLVVLTVKSDPSFPARGIGNIVDFDDKTAVVALEEAYAQYGDDNGMITVSLDVVDKPLEVYYEQIAERVARGLSVNETAEYRNKLTKAIESGDFVPAGRVLYGAGTDSQVTYFNCYVLPFPQDSREGIAKHRGELMEIMSRGGGCGTNGSTLRPRNALARGVNGKSSGAVSWLNDLAQLTHLVQQGGSRRGAQMIMMNDWHPSIIEFIISKMQNPHILRHIVATTKDDEIRSLAQDKLKFEPLSDIEAQALEMVRDYHDEATKFRAVEMAESNADDYAYQLLKDGGRYSVHDADFLSGANISVGITKEFMQAVENDADYELRFPDIENYNDYDMALYDDHWSEIGDVREWAKRGMAIKTYRTIKARELWNLINICATYSAEPGVFFLDAANDATNAKAYGQQVVCTNPCGEQPLAPYSVCNLAAINLANFVNKQTKQVDFKRLCDVVKTAVRAQDNVIDATPYFLDANERQAKGERRIGLGVMGLADMLIYAGKTYGSAEGNALVDKVFETIATTSYRASIDLAKEKGSFGYMAENEEAVRKAFVDTGYMQNMPEDVRQGVLAHGIRNSHLLTVAPTGSTGSMIGVATGLEPYFAFKYYRSGRLGKFMEVNANIVQEYLDANPSADASQLPDYFVSAMELSPEQHADTQCVIQRWVDSSISKTVNAPRGYSVEQVQAVYERLYNGGAKGGTVYVDGSRDTQVLTLSNDEKADDGDNATLPIVTDTIPPLEQTDANVGTEIGDLCPVCRKGHVIDAGGCSTCDNCGAQLKCGL